MRIIYYKEELHLSLTRKEVEQINQSIGTPIQLDIKYLIPLHEDINKAVNVYLKELNFYSSDRDYIENAK